LKISLTKTVDELFKLPSKVDMALANNAAKTSPVIPTGNL
jgi:hypothetical protein